MKSIDHKVEGGKLLRIDIKVEDNIIQKIKITGDFFMYPEEAITIIEKKLIGVEINQIKNKIQEIITKREIKIIGFQAEDIEKAIKKINFNN